MTGIDGGNDLFGERVVFNELLVDGVGDEHVAIADIQSMGPNPGAGQNRNSDAAEDQNHGDELRKLYLDAPLSKRSAEQLRFTQKRRFSSGGHIS